MSAKRIFHFLKLSLLLLFYSGLFFYVLTFPSSFAWIIFYFFTFLFVFSYMSTLFSWGKATVSVHTLPGEQKKVRAFLHTKNRLPLLVPRLSFTLTAGSFEVATEADAFFRRRLAVSFPVVTLPRGHYSTLHLRTEGYDLFHLFPYASNKRIPVSLDVFPSLPTETIRKKALETIAPAVASRSRFGANDEQFRQLRARQEQDSMKDVDWKTSFRKRQLLVKEYEKEAARPLTLCLFGAPSSHFEELVSLAYGLYGDLSQRQPVRLLLLGEFDEGVHAEPSVQGFVTVQPATATQELWAIWSQSINRSERRIVIAPKEAAETMKQGTPHPPPLFLTEDDAKPEEVTG